MKSDCFEMSSDACNLPSDVGQMKSDCLEEASDACEISSDVCEMCPDAINMKSDYFEMLFYACKTCSHTFRAGKKGVQEASDDCEKRFYSYQRSVVANLFLLISALRHNTRRFKSKPIPRTQIQLKRMQVRDHVIGIDHFMAALSTYFYQIVSENAADAVAVADTQFDGYL